MNALVPQMLRVWSPGGVIRKVDTVCSTEEHFGNLVAEGLLAEQDYWPKIAASYRSQAAAVHRDMVALKDHHEKRWRDAANREYARGWVARWLQFLEERGDAA